MNHAVVVGVQVITVVAQVILTVVTAVLRSCSESLHTHPALKNDGRIFEPSYFQLLGF